MKLLLLIAVIISSFNCAYAKRAPIDSGKVIQVKYSLSQWNTDSEKIDSGDIILRDVTTKKNLKFEIEETAPDSGIFSGYYSVDWGSGEPVVPEVFVFPQRQELTDKDLVVINQKIEAGEIKRRPILVHRGDDGIQILEVFNTKEEAEALLRILQEGSTKTKKGSPATFGKAALAIHETSELKSFAEAQEKQTEEIERNNYERARLSQSEQHKIEEIKKQQQKLTPAEKAKRAKQATEFADAALDFFKVKKFEDAEKFFKKSFELHPEQVQYYLQYAVTLFRNEKYNEAISSLKLAKGSGVIEAERLYYLALSHYKLKEYDLADQVFDEIVKSRDKKLASTALFYRGVIKFDQKRYEESKPFFQKVIDTSSDPNLDNRAEKKLDEIDALLNFAKNKTKKYIFSATLGGQYDSNVVLSSNSALDQGSATNSGSSRVVSGVGLMWRPVFEKQREFGVKLRTDYVYTVDPALIANDTLVFNLTAPFTFKGNHWNKSVKLDIKPGFESLFLGQTLSGQPAQKLNGVFVDTSAAFIMKSNWYLTGTLQLRNDTFLDIPDQNAFIWKLKANSVFFLDKDNKKGIIAELGLGENRAKGTSYQTNRLDASLLYMAPTKWSQFTFTGGLYYYYLNYFNTKVVNNNMNFIASMNKSMNSWLDMIILGTFMLNESNSVSSMYHKYTISVIFNMETSF